MYDYWALFIETDKCKKDDIYDNFLPILNFLYEFCIFMGQ